MTKVKNDVETKIISIIDKVRPFIINDGGDITFIKYENNVVYVRLSGACADCPMIDVTLNDGIEDLIKNEIPEVEKVVNITTN